MARSEAYLHAKFHLYFTKEAALCYMRSQLPPPKKEDTVPPISAHVRCGQMAGWIKLPLGTKVGLGPSHIVLHGDPSTPQLPLQFSAHVNVAKRSPISATAEHFIKYLVPCLKTYTYRETSVTTSAFGLQEQISARRDKFNLRYCASESAVCLHAISKLR